MEAENELLLGGVTSKKRIQIVAIGVLSLLVVLLAITTIVFLGLFIREHRKDKDEVQSNGASNTVIDSSNDFPLYLPRPWNISNNHPRKLEFTTTESTWTNVDISPDGELILFDCLGDIYTVPIAGGTAEVLLGGIAFEAQPRYSPDGTKIVFTSDRSGCDNIHTYSILDGQLSQITSEWYHYMGNPYFASNGSQIVASKWYYTERSIPAGEIWSFPTSGTSELNGGIKLRGRISPDAQVGPQEPLLSKAGDVLYWSENTADSMNWNYNKDPHAGIFQIKSLNLNNSQVTTVAGGPGSAARPILSHSELYMAFIRRTEFNTSLILKDLTTGNEVSLWNGLELDMQESSCPLGVYPNFAFTPDDKHIVIWAKGLFYKVPVFDFSLEVIQIPVTIPISLDLANTVRFNQSKHVPTPSTFNPKVVLWVNILQDNANNASKLLFTAVGKTFLSDLSNNDTTPEELPSTPQWLQSEASWILNSNSNLKNLSEALVGNKYVQVSWSDEWMGRIEVLDLNNPNAEPSLLTSGMQGRFVTPSISSYWEQSSSDSDIYYTKLVYTKLGSTQETGSLYTLNSGIYLLDIQYNASSNTFSPKNNNSVPQQILSSSYNHPIWVSRNQIAVHTGWFPTGNTIVYYNIDTKQQTTQVTCKYCTQLEISPNGNWVVFSEFNKIFAASLSGSSNQIISSRPGVSKNPTFLIAPQGGHQIFYPASGATSSDNIVYWVLANEVSQVNLNTVSKQCSPGLTLNDSSCPVSLVTTTPLIFEVATNRTGTAASSICIYNATVYTMKPGSNEVLSPATVFIENDRIASVQPNAACPDAQLIINANLSVLMPGFVDVHAHFSTGGDLYTQNSWEYILNLAYGVTTVHNPSATSEQVFYESELIRSGIKIGPRMFSTGTILYGGGGTYHVEVSSLEEAENLVINRMKYGAWSIKSYNQPARSVRQQILAAATKHSMNVVPEGGNSTLHLYTLYFYSIFLFFLLK